MEQKKLVPKRRFEGFTEEWKERTIGELADIVGGGTPSTGNKEYWDGDIDWYSPVEIGEQIYVDGSQRKITELGLQKSSARILPVGTVLFTSRAGIGNTAILAKEGATNQGFQSILPHGNELDTYFIFSRSHELKRYGETNGAGSTFVEVSGKQMAKMPLLVPGLDEQQKIGHFFKRLDEMITTQQRKLEKAKALKSAYLAEMFPTEGERVPKRRFSGFTDEWKLRELQDVCYVFDDGDWIESKDQSNNGIRLIQTGNIGFTEFINNESNKKWISEATFKRLNCNEVFPGDILISRLPDPAGRACIIPDLGTRMITSVDCTIVRTSEKFSADFLVQYLSTSNYFKTVTSLLGGGTRQRISRSYLATIKVPFPQTLDEQKRIGSFFKIIDKTITFHQRKLEKLQALKQAYLHEMFV